MKDLAYPIIKAYKESVKNLVRFLGRCRRRDGIWGGRTLSFYML